MPLNKVGFIKSTGHYSREFVLEIIMDLNALGQSPVFQFQSLPTNADSQYEGINSHLHQNDIINFLTHMKQNGIYITLFLPWFLNLRGELLSQYYYGNIYQVIPISQYNYPNCNTFARNYKQRKSLSQIPSNTYTYDTENIPIECKQKSGLNRTGLHVTNASLGDYLGATDKIS